MRCPNCGGLNKDGAEWCGQCLTRFGPGIPAAAPAAGPHFGPAAPAAASQAADVAQGSSTPSATWQCPVCLAENPLTADVCSSCGTLLFEALRSETSKPAGVKANPTVAAVLSLVPGGGHLYLRRIADAVARLLIALWWAATAFAVSGRNPALFMVRTLFWLAFVALAVICGFDAYRQAEEPEAKPVLSSRLLLYWSLGMLAVLAFGLSIIAFSLQR